MQNIRYIIGGAGDVEVWLLERGNEFDEAGIKLRNKSAREGNEPVLRRKYRSRT